MVDAGPAADDGGTEPTVAVDRRLARGCGSDRRYGSFPTPERPHRLVFYMFIFPFKA
jgi:hypothetical protein